MYMSAPIALAVAESTTEVRVVVPRQEVAEAEIKAEEKQRVLGFIPNFYVSYISDAEPLNSKQKFELAWRSTIDPVTFLITAASAGLEQADGQFGGYGQGARKAMPKDLARLMEITLQRRLSEAPYCRHFSGKIRATFIKGLEARAPVSFTRLRIR